MDENKFVHLQYTYGMKEIQVFTALSLLLLATLFALFFTKIVDPIVGSGLMFATLAILSWWVVYRLWQVRLRMPERERVVNYAFNDLLWMFFFQALFIGLDFIPHVVLIGLRVNVETITIAHWTSHFFLFIYLIFAVRLATSMFNPGWRNNATIGVGIVCAIALVMSLLNPDLLITIPTSKFPLLHSTPLYSIFHMAANILSVGIAGLYLLVKGFAASDARIRVRAILLALGFLDDVWLGWVSHYSSSPHTPLYLYTGFVFWVLLPGLSALLFVRTRASDPASATARVSA